MNQDQKMTRQSPKRHEEIAKAHDVASRAKAIRPVDGGDLSFGTPLDSIRGTGRDLL